MEAEIAAHEQASQHKNISIPHEEADQHDIFSGLDFSDFGGEGLKGQDGLKTSIETAVSSAGSMQTPPPTSTSASRRKAQKAQAARLVTESASKGNTKPSLPPTQQDQQQSPSHIPEDSPSQFPNLQFSPDGFTFPTSGPATAPVYPQQKLFWDPEQGSNLMNIDMSMDDTFTAFGIATSKALDPYTSDNERGNMLPFTTGPAFSSIETRAGPSRINHPPALNQTNISSSTAIMTQCPSSVKHRGTVVNPSLLFSSPSRAPDHSLIPSSSQPPEDDALQPYAQQIRDAQIERDLKSRKHKRKRPAEHGDSPAVKAAIEALRDDRSESSKSSPVLADSFVGRLPHELPQSGQDIPPRKRMTPDNHYRRRDSQGSLHRRKSDKIAPKRTAVTLRIDASGRAVTQTTVVKDGNGGDMNIDSESESSDSDCSSEHVVTLSRHQSFNRPRSRQRPVRKTRFVDEPYRHSKRSSDASTLASNYSARGFSSVRAGDLQMNTGYAQSRTQPLQGYARQEDDDSEMETIVDSDEDRGDAQSELKKVVRERALKQPTNRSSFSASRRSFKDSNQTYVSHASAPSPYYTTQDMTPMHPTYHDPNQNISPTTITDPDFTTPSSARESVIGSESTRCVCNTADGNGQLMIQW